MKNKKSQSVIFDLFMALFIFIIITSILIILWNRYNIDINDRLIHKEMLLKTYHITDLLVESQGTPSNWQELDDETNIKSLGLADLDRKLSSDKLTKFLDLSSGNYTLTKNLLNIEGFEFYFKLFDINAKIKAESGINPIFFGSDIPGRTTTIRRYVTLEECDERKCVFEFSLWLRQ